MKALTIRQPWAWAIARGHKNVENRANVEDITPQSEPSNLEQRMPGARDGVNVEDVRH